MNNSASTADTFAARFNAGLTRKPKTPCLPMPAAGTRRLQLRFLFLAGTGRACRCPTGAASGRQEIRNDLPRVRWSDDGRVHQEPAWKQQEGPDLQDVLPSFPDRRDRAKPGQDAGQGQQGAGRQWRMRALLFVTLLALLVEAAMRWRSTPTTPSAFDAKRTRAARRKQSRSHPRRR